MEHFELNYSQTNKKIWAEDADCTRLVSKQLWPPYALVGVDIKFNNVSQCTLLGQR